MTQLALSLRDAALAKLETDHRALLAYVRSALRDLYFERAIRHNGDAYVTSDDARRICARLADQGVTLPQSSNWRGALFRTGWVKVGPHVSSAPQGHGNRVYRWRPI